MARIYTLNDSNEEVKRALTRSLQSAHINYLIGAGASFPAVSVAGSVEQEIASLYENNQEGAARERMYGFLRGVQEPTNRLIAGTENAENTATVKNYADYIGIIEIILTERRTNLLPKQATVFSTNYDLFVEKAALGYPALRLNDGFARVPSLDGRMEYDSRSFFTTTSNTGNLYSYKVDIPCINLVKLHGSLSWKKDGETILFSVHQKALLAEEKTPQQVKEFVDSYAVVLPQTTKFRTTLMDSTYYELLRIYNNELDRENALLIAFGFSFGDDHILKITKRALKNPTLKLIAFAFNDVDRDTFAAKFDGYNNVDVIAPDENVNIDFPAFNALFRSCLPGVQATK
jgi:hypothetical protein